ncbi:hypothetical protein [Streptomyces bambusae]|uniref:Uncharacterized protein n=1 Tax=Streptomyces bambusae TaxID=1550616 RepID=A0ABS6Z4V3_9ACTN|nr:hypothetical protein [Streptomyces bambusae]MBW5482803.1 hypothetical protein [Streptomyces bambusae]
MAEQTCGAWAQFFDDEGYEAGCVLPAGHPGRVHEDAIIGPWDEDELYTTRPE